MTKEEVTEIIERVAREQCAEIDRLAKENPEANGGRFSAGSRTAVIYYMEALVDQINP